MDLAKVTECMVGGNRIALLLFLSPCPRLCEVMGSSSVVSYLTHFLLSTASPANPLAAEVPTHIFLHIYLFSLLSPCLIQSGAPNISTQIAQTKVRKSPEGTLLEVSASIHRKGGPGAPSWGFWHDPLLAGPVKGPRTVSLATSTQWRRAGRGKCIRKNSSLYTPVIFIAHKLGMLRPPSVEPEY